MHKIAPPNVFNTLAPKRFYKVPERCKVSSELMEIAPQQPHSEHGAKDKKMADKKMVSVVSEPSAHFLHLAPNDFYLFSKTKSSITVNNSNSQTTW